MTTYTDAHTAISRALKAEDLDTELWETGGGCLMAVAVITRGGSPVTWMGEPTGETQAVRYVGITHEAGIGYLLFEYDEASDDPVMFDGLELQMSHGTNTDLHAVTAFVRDHVYAAQHPDEIGVGEDT